MHRCWVPVESTPRACTLGHRPARPEHGAGKAASARDASVLLSPLQILRRNCTYSSSWFIWICSGTGIECKCPCQAAATASMPAQAAGARAARLGSSNQ